MLHTDDFRKPQHLKKPPLLSKQTPRPPKATKKATKTQHFWLAGLHGLFMTSFSVVELPFGAFYLSFRRKTLPIYYHGRGVRVKPIRPKAMLV